MRKLIFPIAILVIGAVIIFGLTKKHDDIVPTPTFSQVISTPEITFGYPEDFGLATNKNQVLAHAYIPPCGEGFDWCLYYNGKEYSGTNFESAGFRITRRSDLAESAQACLSTPPEGYDNFVPTIVSADKYSTSVFAPLSDAGAGHYAFGALYRLYFGATCYEFEPRIGESQFTNYPAGAIQQFTDTDRQNLKARLIEIMDGITISNTKEPVQFLPTSWWANSQ